MRYSGFQPQYFPRLHYFARVLHADIFVLRDDAQFLRSHKFPDGKTGKSYQAHTPIKHAGGIHLLSVPTQHHGLQSIAETLISYDEDWVSTHLRSIELSYGKSPYFHKLFPEIEANLRKGFATLSALNLTTIIWGMLHLLGEEKVTFDKLTLAYMNKRLEKQNNFRLKNIKRASESIALKNKNLTTNEKIIALCKEIGANEDYCGGTGVNAYIDEQLFKKNNIKITAQEWTCHVYTQMYMKHQPFIPNLSIIDLLMNIPIKEAINVINNE